MVILRDSILCGPIKKLIHQLKHTKKGNLITEKHTKALEGGVAGAATGRIFGGSLGLLAGIVPKGGNMGRMLILWLLGVPIFIIILLKIFGII